MAQRLKGAKVRDNGAMAQRLKGAKVRDNGAMGLN